MDKETIDRVTPLVEPCGTPVLTSALDRIWWRICEQTKADTFHAELLTAIVTGMMCPDPRFGMDMLGSLVGDALRRRDAAITKLTTELRPLEENEPADSPLEWDFRDPELRAIMEPEYRGTAEYHYAMAAYERALRNEK